MPRRDELSEEKRKRLMQEHEQLQKLMLQARSSVRRSSLKEEEVADETASDRIVSLPATPNSEEVFNIPVEERKDSATPEKKPLTEKELFPSETPMNTTPTEPQPLTERDLFKETKAEVATQPLQKNNTVNVILPNQITTAPVVQPRIERTETVAAPQPEIEDAAPQEVFEEQLPIADTYGYNSDDEIQEPKRSKARTLVLVFILLLLAGFGGYYLYQSNQNHTTTAATPHDLPTPVVPTPLTPTPSDTTQAQRTDETVGKTTTQATPSNKQTGTKAQDTQKPLSEELKDFDNVTVVKTPATSKIKEAQPHNDAETGATSNASPGKYKVISKAYFHNEPDESTRRKAFMTHWDNAVLTPLDERNGFIYIVFTNHLGQTSKGWLRKSDLKRID